MTRLFREIHTDEEKQLVLDLFRASLSQSSGLLFWTLEALQEELSLGLCFGAFVGKQLAAFVTMRKIGSNFEIEMLCTHPVFRKKGWMRELMSWIMDHNPAPEYWLEVHEGNKEALSFYEAFGFCKQHLRKGYYPDGGGAYLMTKSGSFRSSPQSSSP